MSKKVYVHKDVLTLYHYTCEHSLKGISESGTLKGNPHPLLPHLGSLLWLTDITNPTRESVGLTNTFTRCDRLHYRYIVRCAATPWAQVRAYVKPEVLEALEAFGEPDHWWVMRRQLTCSEFTFDETWRC